MLQMSDKKRGRPSIPAADRRQHRITIRLNAAEQAQLAELKALSGSGSDGEIVRAAISAQLKRLAGASSSRKTLTPSPRTVSGCCPTCGTTGFDPKTRFCPICM